MLVDVTSKLALADAFVVVSAPTNHQVCATAENIMDRIWDPSQIEDILQANAAKARKEARELLDKVRDAVGIRPLK